MEGQFPAAEQSGLVVQRFWPGCVGRGVKPGGLVGTGVEVTPGGKVGTGVVVIPGGFVGIGVT